MNTPHSVTLLCGIEENTMGIEMIKVNVSRGGEPAGGKEIVHTYYRYQMEDATINYFT